MTDCFQMPTPLSAADLMAMELSPRAPVLEPILRRESLALLYGPRGIGKSFLALGMALAAASGTPFLKWQAPRPRQVLYIDNELAGIDLRQRVAALGPPPETLRFLIGGLKGKKLPDLGRGEGQCSVWLPWRESGPPDLLVLDSLSSLVGTDRAKAGTWKEARHFLTVLRSIGMAVLVVHHGTRRGELRGPRDRQDVFDTVMSLGRPADYRPREGLRVELHFEKARRLWGPAADPFEARMVTDQEGRARWDWHPTGAAELHRAAALLGEGLNAIEVARELGISRSKSYRLREEALRIGLLQATVATKGRA